MSQLGTGGCVDTVEFNDFWIRRFWWSRAIREWDETDIALFARSFVAECVGNTIFVAWFMLYKPMFIVILGVNF